MSYHSLIQNLKAHKQKQGIDASATGAVIAWIEKHGYFAFVRENLEGHITGSMMIINPKHTKVLLMFHHKLSMWVQFGGHADGDIDILSVAIREFHEESGIVEEPHIIGDIFDIDVHSIPARLSEPEHFHFDILYLGEVPETVSMQKEEGKVDDLRWIDIARIMEYSSEPKMLRVIEKIHNL